MIFVIIVVLVQVAFILAGLGLLVFKKYALWRLEEHFISSLDGLDDRLKKKEISEQTYRNCRYDIEQLYRNFFKKWK